MTALVAAVLTTTPAYAAPVPSRPAAGCGTGSLGATGSAGAESSSGSFGSTGIGGRTAIRSLQVGAVARTYRIHFPAGYPGAGPVPLILAFHGHTESSGPFERYSGLSGLPAIVVYPDGLRGTDGATSWQGAPYSSPRADDLAFTRAMLGTIGAHECVDRQRIYAVGRSNGGGFVGLLACRMPAQFAAFATVSAAVYRQIAAGCTAPQPVSLVDFHGTADHVIHYGGGTRFGEKYLSVDAWLHRWIARDRCAPAPIAVPVTPNTTRFDWPACPDGREIVHYRIAGGTHRWPDAAGLPAAQLIWQFFLAHPR